MPSVINRRDLDFLRHAWLALEKLLTRPRFEGQTVEDIDAILRLAQRQAEVELAPVMKASDITEPWIDERGCVHVIPAVARAVRVMAESGLFGSVFDEELGGLQLPHLVYVAAMGLLMGATVAAPSFMLLTVANARLIATFGNPRQIARFARPQIAGQALGTMCLSEPHAGSSLADIRTRAEFDGEDDLGRRYRVSGSKMWISGGDHDVTEDIVHLVLAKVPEDDGSLAEGARAISLFIVPKRLPDGGPNDIGVVGLNHKMGYRGIPNCALNFGEGGSTPGGKAGAVGWLVGDLGQGLPQMFQMMNEARVAVGLGAAMMAYRGFLLSLDYARNRRQGRLPGVKAGPPVAIIEHADVKRMLLAQKAYAEGALALVLYSARLLDEEGVAGDPAARRRAAEILALLTPITKSWPSEWAQTSLDLAIQVHGGAGYTRDFDVEQLYRDNRLNPIHEGTTGIQGLDLVGRKIRRDDGAAFGLLKARIDETVRAASESSALEPLARTVSQVWEDVNQAVAELMSREESCAAEHATAFLFAMGHGVVGWMWLDQARLCQRALEEEPEGRDRRYREGKLQACRYFVDVELPKVAAWLAPIMAASDVLSSTDASHFIGDVA